MAWKPALLAATTLTAAVFAGTSVSGAAVVDPGTPAAQKSEPVILTGLNIPEWSARADASVKLPLTDLMDCAGTVDPSQGSDPNDWLVADSDCEPNQYQEPELQAPVVGKGAPVDTLRGYRWDDQVHRWEQIPFQVDEVFSRYLNNSASGFALYSGEDQHTTYAFDREGFRYRKEDPSNPCDALPDSEPARDPVPGLDDNDEIAFMASDAGAKAPTTAALPYGTWAAREVVIRDPQNPEEPPRYAYVMRAWDEGGVKPAFDARNGHVRYTRAPDADTFYYSQSNYDSYGNAPKGRFMWEGKCLGASVDSAPAECKDAPDSPPADGDLNNLFFRCPQRHRPGDAATIETNRYRFEYEGRWLLTGLQISPDGGLSFGPDLVDRWKARAFAQDPYSETPCCGYEDEDKNWGGSSNLIGERSGPVRTIRETWGADSGTNVIRRETFYRDTMRQKTFLRVHVIPPVDGIYAQWDFNAGAVDRYYNPRLAEGVAVDGRNDEVFGNLDDPCNGIWDGNERSELDGRYREAYRDLGLCGEPWNEYHQSIDVTDPTFANVNASLDWNMVTGDNGTVVDRYQLEKVTDVTAGGTPQSLFAVPYYRDDSCFDDGTGSDPGPRVLPRSDKEPRTYTAPDGTTKDRQCWKPEDGAPGSDNQKFFQGDIGTHGLHLLLVAESDNARLTVPVTEIVSEQRMAFLPGRRGPEVGEQYGRGFEKPLVATVTFGYDPKVQDGPPASEQPPSDGQAEQPAGTNGGTTGVGAFAPAAGDGQSVRGERVKARTAVPCLPRTARVTKLGIAGIRIGDSEARVARRLGRPTSTSAGGYRWCVRGGGALVAVFDRTGRVRFLATTARSYEAAGGIGTGDRLRRQRGTRRLGSDLIARGNVVIGVRAKRVRFVAVTRRGERAAQIRALLRQTRP